MSEARPKGYTLEEGLVSVGKGWAELIHKLFESKPTNIDIIQIKEKFGQLRVYTDPFDEDFNKVVNVLEKLSGAVCEDCSMPGTMTTDRRWMLTLCYSCKQKRGRT